MEITSRSRNFQLSLFGILYFVQGVIQAYQLNFFKPHMNSEGIPAELIGLFSSIAILPFILKILYGILSDRVNLFGRGHRLPYMSVGVILCAVLFFSATFISPSASFGLFATVVLGAVFAMALFDTTADALAVDITPEEDQGLVQGAMTSGRALGLIVISFIFGLMADRYGYSSLYLAIGLLLLIPLGFLLIVREPAKRQPSQQFDWSAFRIFGRPEIAVYAIFLIVAWFVFQSIDGLITFYMDNLGATGTQLGTYGSLKGIGMVGGALLSGFLIRRLGSKTAALCVGLAVGIGGIIVSLITAIPGFFGFAIIWGVAAGLHWTVYSTISMRVTDIRIAASMFAILATMGNIGLAVGEGVAVSLTESFSFSAVFQMLAAGTVAVIAMWWLVFRMFKAKGVAV